MMHCPKDARWYLRPDSSPLGAALTCEVQQTERPFRYLRWPGLFCPFLALLRPL